MVSWSSFLSRNTSRLWEEALPQACARNLRGSCMYSHHYAYDGSSSKCSHQIVSPAAAFCKVLSRTKLFGKPVTLREQHLHGKNICAIPENKNITPPIDYSCTIERRE